MIVITLFSIHAMICEKSIGVGLGKARFVREVACVNKPLCQNYVATNDASLCAKT